MTDRQRTRSLRVIPAFGILIALTALGITAKPDPGDASPADCVAVEIHIGRPPWCHGRGLCRMTPTNAQQREIGDIQGLLCYDRRGHLTLKLPTTPNSHRLWHDQMQNGSFRVESPIPLPKPVADALPRNTPEKLVPGYYRTKRTTDTLYIFFTKKTLNNQ